MGHKQTLILLEIHVEMVENYDQFWPFLEKCQVGVQIAVLAQTQSLFTVLKISSL